VRTLLLQNLELVKKSNSCFGKSSQQEAEYVLLYDGLIHHLSKGTRKHLKRKTDRERWQRLARDLKTGYAEDDHAASSPDHSVLPPSSTVALQWLATYLYFFFYLMHQT
jgi:hypothetical protein